MQTKQQLWQIIHQACEGIPDGVDLASELIQERRLDAKEEELTLADRACLATAQRLKTPVMLYPAQNIK